MTTVAYPDVSASGHRAHEQRLHQYLHALQRQGWEQRLQPLATHMAAQRLVRARGDASAPLRHLDLEVLRQALCALLRQDDDAFPVYQLVVEGTEPSQVAAERGISRAVLVEQ